MRILITGATGLVGRALSSLLRQQTHEVVQLTRSAAGAGKPRWNPDVGEIDVTGLEGFDAVIHLAGEPIADAKWSPEKKARIRDSRIKGTRLLSDSLARLAARPKVLISASAIGIYGDRGDEVLTEESGPGSDFLSEVGVAWESGAQFAADAGIRVVNARFGIVLSADGGALHEMIKPMKMGIGGPLGNGRQWMSWIDIDDLCAAILHLTQTDSVHGPVNLVAPNPVTNRDFTRTLARVIHRPAFIPAPAPALRLMFGEMADAILLSSQRVQPRRLMDSGYRFRYTHLEDSLRHLLLRKGES